MPQGIEYIFKLELCISLSCGIENHYVSLKGVVPSVISCVTNPNIECKPVEVLNFSYPLKDVDLHVDLATITSYFVFELSE